MDGLGDGQGQPGPFTVTLLTVRRYGIVDQGLHAVVGQIPLQFVTAPATDGEDVVDIPSGFHKNVRDLNYLLSTEWVQPILVSVIGLNSNDVTHNESNCMYYLTRIFSALFPCRFM